MQIRKAKIILILVLALFVFFFSNDFGLIDVEKTSIITAIAIDKNADEYTLTAQIAVPEATDTNSENLKAQISGKGTTIGGALKDLGDISGWFPKLSFCNLIILGNSFSNENVITVLDYFAKTLRVQDSALVALAENSASELLNLATPLDNISAFALQKILLKNTGFNRDIRSTDVKTFCSGHYSNSKSAYMPIIKKVSAGESEDTGTKGSQQNANSDPQKEEQAKNNLFNARTTALFKDGKKVGELDENQTLTLNALTQTFKGTTFPVNDVDFNGQKTNYLLTVLKNKPTIKLKATENQLTLDISLSLYCKISDHSADGSNQALSQNIPLPENVKIKAQEFFYDNINELILTEKQTGCDFLDLKQKLYRYNYKQYSHYKDNYLDLLDTKISVTVSGQK